MIKYCFVILSILPFGIRQLHAQDKAIWYVGLAGYTHGYVSRPEDNENTRAISTRDNTVEKLKSYYNSRGVGFTLERFNPEAQFSFAVGLQYLKAESDIHLPTLRLTDPTFFLVKYREVDTETDYASVLSVYQVGHYMTVPIVAKWFPLNRVRTKLYLMVGGNINFLMRYNTSVNLPNTTLKGFDSLIADQFEAPRDRSASVFAGLGFRYGATGKPTVGIELNFPSLFLTPGSMGITHPTAGMGASITFALPINPPTQ